MVVLYVYQGDWPRNATRVAKETRSLAEAGHHVVLLAGNPNRAARRQQAAWMEVRRLPAPPSRLLRRLTNYPLFINPIWLWYVWRTARTIKADSIVVRDLPLAPVALLAGHWLRIPVHYDMADVYPVLLRANREDHPGFMNRLMRNATVAAWVERQVLRRVATVFVVAEESRARCLALNVPAPRAVLVGNTPANIDELTAPHPVPDDLVSLRDRDLVLFVGNLLADRGLDLAIRAMTPVAAEITGAALVLIGDGRERQRLERFARELGLQEHVYFLGWKPHCEHAPYYAYAKVGILPFLATEHICITLANKLFDYMGAGLPVVASDVPPMRRILAATRSGLLVPPGDSAALSRAIATLLRDATQRATLGQNGRRAVAAQYRWAVDGQRFLAAIESARNGRTRRGA
jgi:glycosyltransferase involved in cell wall biosynthesis